MTKRIRYIVVATAVLLVGLGIGLKKAYSAANAGPAPIADIDAKAHSRTAVHARVVLAAGDHLQGLNSKELLETDHVPNYLRALATYPGGAEAFAHLFRTVLYSGELEPEVKMAMGLRVAQTYSATYVALHAERLLRVTPRGEGLLQAIKSGKLDSLAPADQLAIKYADLLTPDVHGVSDDDFRSVRAYFNDSQVVELTLTVCFFNYFTRIAEGFNLPLEAWALDTTAQLQIPRADPPLARVGLISDTEMKSTREMQDAMNNPKNPASSWRIGFANSMRAMLRSPEIAAAWRDYGAAVRQSASIDREIQLQVSFAVSMANGCRYCTLHQVLGLQRLGVSMSKLMAMKKDDEALTPSERTAVLFARKLTRDPVSVNDADYASLKTEFGDRGASDVVLQTCAFAFMNRFTDGLRLPSEDEAVRVYREVYKTDWKNVKWQRAY
jgi:AhpD family alkylhydroperoxidase